MFKWLIGSFCFVAGAIFLAINSVILFRGAYRFGHDQIDQIAFGVAAAVVPWVIAVLPALVSQTWQKTILGLWRPTTSTMAVIVVWVVFIGYNLTNGAGVIATSRLETVADKSKIAEDVQRVKDRRELVASQLAKLGSPQPSAAIEQEINAKKTNLGFKLSGECAEPKTRYQRSLCGDIAKLEGDKLTAARAEALSKQLADLDAKLSASGPVVASADPQADLLHDITGADRTRIQIWLPAMTPIVLEIGAALMWHFSFLAFGVSFSIGPARGDPLTPEEPTAPAAMLMSPEAAAKLPEATLSDLTASRQLCEWFFRECTRHVPGGSMPEEKWFAYYVEICRRSGDKPLPLEAFRRIAMRCVPRIQDVDGVSHYQEILPLIPNEAA